MRMLQAGAFSGNHSAANCRRSRRLLCEWSSLWFHTARSAKAVARLDIEAHRVSHLWSAAQKLMKSSAES